MSPPRIVIVGDGFVVLIDKRNYHLLITENAVRSENTEVRVSRDIMVATTIGNHTGFLWFFYVT